MLGATLTSWMKRHWQIVYAIFLIILVPILIVANTIYSVNTFKRNTDIALQRQAVLVGKMFNIAARDYSAHDSVAMQNLIEEIAAQVGSDIYALEVLVPDGKDIASESFEVVASVDTAAIGRKTSEVQAVLSWTQNQAFAFLSNSPVRTAAPSPEERVRGDDRYWSVIMPITDPSGGREGLLFMKLSLSTIDAIVSATLLRSYFFLVITVLITILILASNTRLFQYALLFRKLKEVDKMKDEFISVASHELKAPIAALKGFISLFLDNAFGPFKGVAREKMDILMLLSDRLGDLVEDLLNVSQIEQGSMDIDQEPIQPEELIETIMDEFEARAKEKGLKFEFDKPDTSLPKIFVDPHRLKQVLANLISNAIKYSLKGTVEIRAFLDEGHVRLKVTDTGLGMSPEARERLFTKFYRIQNDETREIPGTGLGLWITKQLVELQDGKIFVDSIEGVGTQMTVMFPAMSEDDVKKAIAHAAKEEAEKEAKDKKESSS